MYQTFSPNFWPLTFYPHFSPKVLPLSFPPHFTPWLLTPLFTPRFTPCVFPQIVPPKFFPPIPAAPNFSNFSHYFKLKGPVEEALLVSSWGRCWKLKSCMSCYTVVQAARRGWTLLWLEKLVKSKSWTSCCRLPGGVKTSVGRVGRIFWQQIAVAGGRDWSNLGPVLHPWPPALVCFQKFTNLKTWFNKVFPKGFLLMLIDVQNLWMIKEL